ncbi:MAG TPA: ABC transporter ATP-binding protein [Myxococcaceae bacterium]|jgi:ABC-2 type transport system ATP-binding protein
MSALELESVTKRFGDKVAVNNLSLRLEPGTFLGLLGRNGAGKSTTLKLVTGLLRPTSGRIRVLGLDVETHPLEVKRQIGVMPEDMALLELLTGPQYLRFVGRVYGLEEAVIDQRQDELFELLDLRPGPKTLLAEYSFGMKKKIALCAAVLHSPRLVFLDEPFEGIDPVTSRTVKDLLLSLQQRGVTLVLTTHILEVVERLCPLIAILDEGQLKGHGSLDALRQGKSLESLFLSLVGGEKKAALSWL